MRTTPHRRRDVGRRVCAALSIVVAGFISACARADAPSTDDQPSVTTTTVSTRPITLPPPSPSIPSAPDQPLTVAANGAHLALHVGQHRSVHLVPREVPGNFDPLTASRQGIVTISDESGGYPGDDPLVATITAITPGITRLTTQSDLSCFHSSPPCLPPQYAWTLDVTVQK
jgi:hypothetical protein